MRSISFAAAGLVLGLGLLLSPMAQAQSKAPNYLQIQTANGGSVKASVRFYKGLGQAVIVTMVKEGKMNASSVNQNNPTGQMTFFLDPGVSDDFLAWAANPDSQTSGSNGAQFQWVDAHGIVNRTFHMTGLKVVKFAPGSPKGSGGTLILVADHTDADPPFNFKNK